MKILLSNDDGIYANGINVLAKALASEHEVYISAPDGERSAASHALTLTVPLRVKELTPELGIKKSFAISGTPADCVKIAISTLLSPEEMPDIMISGINHGPNLGFDIMYSGTVNCAMETATMGIPSIAVSLDGWKHEKEDFIHIAEFMKNFVKKVRNYKFPPKTLLNINFPACPKEEITGIAITKVGNKVFTDEYEKRIDTHNRPYYWLSGKRILDSKEFDTDIAAIRENKITITPLTFELSKEEYLKDLQNSFNNIDEISKLYTH